MWLVILLKLLAGCFFCSVLTIASVSGQESFRAAVFEHRDPSDPSRNLEDIMMDSVDTYEDQIRSSAELGVHILVFPEYGLSGVSVPDTRDGLRPYLQVLPGVEPDSAPWTPCFGNGTDFNVTILKRLSCAAMDNAIVLVVNVGTVVECTFDPNNGSVYACPSDSVYQFNTDVVFGADGSILATYHKMNLYHEPAFDRPPYPSDHVTTFTTDVASFGLITCFDLIYHDPLITLVEDHGIRYVAMPTAWVDGLPFLTSVQSQMAWAIGLNISIMAANIQNSEDGYRGSGIYHGTDGFLNYIYGPLNSSRLLWADVPLDQQSLESITAAQYQQSSRSNATEQHQQFNGSIPAEQHQKPSKTIAVEHHHQQQSTGSIVEEQQPQQQSSESTAKEQEQPSSGSSAADLHQQSSGCITAEQHQHQKTCGFIDPEQHQQSSGSVAPEQHHRSSSSFAEVAPQPETLSAPQFLNYSGIIYDDLTNYTFVELGSVNGGAVLKLETLSCMVQYEFETAVTEGAYFLAGYDGFITLGYGEYRLAVQTCALMWCPDSDTDDCCRPPVTSTSRLVKLILEGNFSTSYVYPSVLRADLQLVDTSQWHVVTDVAGHIVDGSDWRMDKRVQLISDPGFSHCPLMAGLYGRLYDKDND